MKLSEFDVNVARQVMNLWNQHLGLHYFGSQKYFDCPHLLVLDARNPRFWLCRRYENRIGSRWTEDSKLFMYLNRFGNEGLRIEAYVQAQNLMVGRDEAQRGEDEFNRVVKEYVDSFDKTS